jgi:hypothetical protein
MFCSDCFHSSRGVKRGIFYEDLFRLPIYLLYGKINGNCSWLFFAHPICAADFDFVNGFACALCF